MPRLPAPPLFNACSNQFDDFPRSFAGDRVFPGGNYWSGGERRRAVCKRCGLLMRDAEPSCRTGEFYHIAKPYQTRALACRNNGNSFTTEDAEVVPFMRKARRRFLKRQGIRA